MLKQKVFFDTNVCHEIARRTDANEFVTVIGMRFEIMTSPMVFAELVSGFDGSSERFWEHHKNRIRAAVGNRGIKFMKLPREFAFAKVLGVSKRGLVSPERFREWTRTILLAESKSAVFQKVRELEYIVEAMLTGWERHSAIVLATPGNAASSLSANRWGHLLAQDFGVPVDDRQATKLADALSVAYQRIVHLRKLYTNRNSMPENRRGDWVDVLNLFYLCDPAMRLVTKERKMIHSLNLQTPQPQLLEYQEFIEQFGYS